VRMDVAPPIRQVVVIPLNTLDDPHPALHPAKEIHICGEIPPRDKAQSFKRPLRF